MRSLPLLMLLAMACKDEPSNADDTAAACDERTFYADADGDGFGGDDSTSACEAPSGYVAQSTDCDDQDAGLHPEAAEVCDGVDNDCDGGVDNAPTDGVSMYVDSDGDGFGDAATETLACADTSGLTAQAGDCDDGDAAISPDAWEACDGVDNDCDGTADGHAVPGDFATIGEAVAGAADGELICIAAGTYSEAVHLEDRSLTLQGAGVGETILATSSGAGALTLLRSPSAVESMTVGGVQVAESDGAELRDLEISGTWCDATDCHGTALNITESTADLMDVDVVNNTQTTPRGGVQLYGVVALNGDITWQGGRITNNEVVIEAGGSSSTRGIVYANAAVLNWTDVTIEDNRQVGTLINPNGSAALHMEGTLHLVDSELNFNDVSLLGNHVQSDGSHSGGGVASGYATSGLKLSGCDVNWSGGSISRNSAESTGSTWASFYINNVTSSTWVMSDVLINDNVGSSIVADGTTSGTSTHLNSVTSDWTRVEMRGNSLYLDSPSSSGHAILANWSGTAEIRNSLFAGNTIVSRNGTAEGMLLFGYMDSSALYNSAVHMNVVYAHTAGSAGITTSGGGYFTLVNSAITDNQLHADTTDSYHEGASALFLSTSNDLRNNAFSGNFSSQGRDIWQGSELALIGADGNIAGEPSYTDVSGSNAGDWDFTLQSGSAYIDAGDASISDVDGSTSDIGVYGGPDAPQ